MTEPRIRGRSMGVLSLAVPPPADLPAPWDAVVDGENWGQVVASGLPLVIGELIERKLEIPCTPALADHGDPKHNPRLPVHSEWPELKRIADLGRELGFDLFLSGRIFRDQGRTLEMRLVDCERRREAAHTRLEFDHDDLREWAVAVVRWLAEEAGLRVGLGEVGTGAASEQAFHQYLQALRFCHLVDAEDHPKRPDLVLELLMRALEEDPGYSSALATLDTFVRGSLRPQEVDYLGGIADRLMAAAQRVPPEKGYGVLSMAATLLSVKEATDVVPLLERPLGEDFEPARLDMLARLCVVADDEARAEVAARDAVARFPDAVHLKVLLAELLESEGDGPVAEAQGLWDEVLLEEPLHRAALASRTRGLVSEDAERAVELAQRALTHEDLPWQLLDALRELVTTSDRARDTLRPLLEQRPVPEHVSPVFHAKLGSLLHALGLRERADLHFTVALDQGLPHPYAARVHALRQFPEDGDFADRAERLAQRAVHEEPAAVQESLAEALAMRDDFWPFRFLLGYVLDRQKSHDAAAEHYAAACEMSRDAVEVLFHRGQNAASRDRLEEAETHLKAAVRRSPRQPAFLKELARTLLRSDKKTEARECLELVLRLKPGDHEASDLLRDELG